MFPRLIALLLIAGALVAAATGAGAPSQPAIVSASAHGISILVPGQPASVAAESTAPGTASTGVADGFVFPADGSLVRTGALSSSVSSRSTGAAGAQGVSDVLGVTLFNGEITAESVAGRAKASAAGADAAGAKVVNLVVLGTPVAATPNLRIALGDWGFLVALEQVVEAPVADGTRNARGAVNGLHVVLTADHAGLPAGTEILVGHAEAAASTSAQAPPPTVPATEPPKPTRPAGVPAKTRKPLPKPPEPGVLPHKPGSVFRIPPTDVSAPLSPNGYVFPVYGPSSFSDTFRAPRAGVIWHHGQDIFAPLGAPLLAVADGTLFSIGWNERGGYRLWLRDRQGNQFYYAHLSAFSPLAVDGNEVKAGDVVGFLGNTGDAQTTPYHLHFEIHPVGLLPLGYDGVVNPFAYLSAWRRLQDISFAAGRGWAPPVPANATAPHPAVILLGSSDISSASGLDPSSLDRALTAPVSQGDGAVLGAG
ncbi:MAG: peptidoglycan DD-metalloendopeptidase family protein [Thermoleophilia bacterium]|nr:peptidoglycan DD-metalloendopeptidase family protein [Thermoleophilia bacterium]